MKPSIALLTALLLPAIGHAQAPPQSPIPVPQRPSALAAGQSAPKITDIWVVFKTHCDLGYTMSAEAVNEKYRVAMMDNAIRLMEADKAKPADQRFKWTIAGWPMAGNILGPKQDPARKAKIEEGLRSGAFAVHALPASMESDAMEIEDFVRGLGFASKVARTYGQPLPISAKLTDVPAHCRFLPTLLANAGVKFLQIGANYSNRSPFVPPLFWWEGPDGSRVLCNFTPAYGSELMAPKDWPSRHYLAVIMTHDNEGPPSPGEVETVRAHVAKMPGVKLHFATMDEFAHAILAEKLDIPVIKGDMADPWIHGVSAMPDTAKTMRNACPLEPALEQLDTELKGWSVPTSDISQKLAEAYENSMLYGEHTFGAMSPWYGFWSTGMPGRFMYGDAFREARAKGFYKKFERSFEDKRDYIRRTDTIVRDGLKERMDLLANVVKAPADSIIVHNPLPWSRSGLVEVNGHTVFAENVPAGGYKTITAKADTPNTIPAPSTLETKHFKITLDLKRGGIASLIEKQTGRELVDRSSPYALGQFLHEKFSSAQVLDYYNRYCTMNNSFNASAKPEMPQNIPYAAVTPTAWQASLQHGTVADTITLTAGDTLGLGKAVSLTFTFPAHAPTLDMAWHIEGKTPETLPEGGWLCFPCAVKDPQFLLGRLGGVTDLAKDQVVGGNRYLFAINSGVALAAPDRSGIGLCALDTPLMSFGEPGLWKYDYDFLPKTPTVFVHLYNNMWNTNFPYWSEGNLSARVRLWQLEAKQPDALATPSWEARVPLLAVAATGKGDKLPPTRKGIELSRKGVLVTAYGNDPDGNKGTLLRVWNQTAQGGDITITLPSPFKTATPVNLRGVPVGQPIPIKDAKLTRPLPAYAPASFILQ